MDTSPPRTDAMELRRLAEAAASCRADNGKVSYLYVNEHGYLDIMCGDAPPNIVLEVKTETIGTGRTPPDAVTMVHQEVPTENLARRYDAVFWSESAVEKFVLPYYASLKMWEAAKCLSDLSTAWYGYVPDTSGHSGIPEAAVIPFALAHTPDSNYSPLTTDGSCTTDVFHVLFKKGDAIIALPVSEFLGTYRRDPNG